MPSSATSRHDGANPVTAASAGRAAVGPWHSPWLARPLLWSGIGIGLFGGLVIAGWYAHWDSVVRGTPGLSAMKVNAALCFALYGACVALMTTARKSAAVTLAGAAVLIALLTLLEYAMGRSFWLDQIVLPDYLTPADELPGRMSPLSATCFVFIGTGLMLSAFNRIRPWQLAIAGLWSCLVGVIAIVSLGGFLAGMEAAYGWDAYTRMAMHTAAGLCVLSLALLAWTWEVSARHEINLARWLPLAGSITLMAVVALLAVVGLRELRNSYQARKTAYEALVSTQYLLGGLTDTLRGMSGYVMSGQPDSLQPYQRGIVAIERELARLSALARHDPVQRALELQLASDLQAVIAYANGQIALRDAHGLQAAIRADSSAGRLAVDRARIDVQALTDEVHRQVLERDRQAEQNYRHTVVLLVMASVVAALLLGFAQLAVSREVLHRRRIEAKLQEDISQRTRHEAEMRLSEERFRRAFDDAPIGMALVSPEHGQWLEVNRALCDMLGYSEAELMAKNHNGIVHPDDIENDRTLSAQVLEGSIGSYQSEQRYLHRGGEAVYVKSSVSLVRSLEGSPQYFVSQIENVTERREMDRLKRDFIATVSHELRTPLTSIRGSLGLLAGGAMGALPEKIAPMVTIALQNCERLVIIINDILDIEKIEAGKSQLTVGRVAVAPLLRQALAMNADYAAKYHVTLVLEEPASELQVLADPDRLMQVLTNLLSNAAKFSPAGASVRVRALSDDQHVRFEVEDDGSGIPEDFRARIFQKFAQAESSAGRHFGGTGLGLAISRSLVEQMGGRIHFDSRTGGGTIFFVELPRVGAEPHSFPVALPSDTSRRRRLIRGVEAVQLPSSAVRPRLLHVEDDNDLSTVLQAALSGRAEVVIARTLGAARRLLQEQEFAAVVLDPGLPDGDGLALLDQIEHIGPRSPPVVILSVTDVPREIRGRVAAVLVKSRIGEFDLAQLILSVIDEHAERTALPV
jgi:PAS domain S-box-containing protein